jgi:hypothetical protein
VVVMKRVAHLRAVLQQPAQPQLVRQLANPLPSLPVVLTTWTTTFLSKIFTSLKFIQDTRPLLEVRVL